MRILLFILTFSFLSSQAQSQTCSTVDGANLCVHQHMPLLSQSDTSNGQVLRNGAWSQVYKKNKYNKVATHNRYAVGFDSNKYVTGLLETLSLKKGRYISWDQGWCGGTSASMLFKAYGVERKLGGNYFGQTNLNEFMYQTFRKVDTDIKGGGTDKGDVKDELKDILSANSNRSSYTTSIPSAAQYKTSGLPAFYISIKGKMPKSGGGTTTLRHAIVLNGIDGSNHIIYDPWKAVYRVKISGSSMKWIKGQTGSVGYDTNDTVSITGSYGFKYRAPATAPTTSTVATNTGTNQFVPSSRYNILQALGMMNAQ